MPIATKAPPRAPVVEAWALIQDLILNVQRPRWLALGTEFEITPPQLMTLRRLDPDQPSPMSELARWLACDASNVTGIVDRLEARGLVERRAAPHDRRVKMLALTAEGRAVRDELEARMAEPPAELAALAPADRRALRDILRRATGH
ncbi:MAG: MarR family transcriptional regulator [Solirubrobacterales bacterium]|nr:MarR family transcriptional regulator [Solirubrobacterales bacterium]